MLDRLLGRGAAGEVYVGRVTGVADTDEPMVAVKQVFLEVRARFVYSLCFCCYLLFAFVVNCLPVVLLFLISEGRRVFVMSMRLSVCCGSRPTCSVSCITPML